MSTGRRLGVTFAVAAALFALIALSPAALQVHLTVFALAIVIGYYVIGNVHHALHTPLMSVTNAISGIIVVGALLQIGHGDVAVTALACVAILLASINVFGGFAVTRRMLGNVLPELGTDSMFTVETAATAAYVVAALLFILALAGLSKHETSRAGNTFGMAGMAIALVATIALALARHIEPLGLGAAARRHGRRRRDRPVARSGGRDDRHARADRTAALASSAWPRFSSAGTATCMSRATPPGPRPRRWPARACSASTRPRSSSACSSAP